MGLCWPIISHQNPYITHVLDGSEATAGQRTKYCFNLLSSFLRQFCYSCCHNVTLNLRKLHTHLCQPHFRSILISQDRIACYRTSYFISTSRYNIYTKAWRAVPAKALSIHARMYCETSLSSFRNTFQCAFIGKQLEEPTGKERLI